MSFVVLATLNCLVGDGCANAHVYTRIISRIHRKSKIWQFDFACDGTLSPCRHRRCVVCLTPTLLPPNKQATMAFEFGTVEFNVACLASLWVFLQLLNTLG